MKKPQAEIYIDVHEDDSGLIDVLESRGIGNCQRLSLETGDVVIRHNGHEVGIEIKRVHDYLNSLHSGRLSDQLFRMLQTYDFPILIVEGWKPFVGDDTTAEDVEETVTKYNKSIRTLNRRICVIETADQQDTADVIEGFIADINAKKFHYLRRKVILQETSPQLKVLCSLPNVSIARAEEILDIWGSPRRAIEFVDEWTEINGITQERMEKIKEILEGEK